MTMGRGSAVEGWVTAEREEWKRETRGENRKKRKKKKKKVRKILIKYFII